ncbi:hypothetical protein FQN54_006568 [Arachnomyces sp. PD_36]|nr:hypothetical protein FQN54_006568 [Arachnomyces sp. PD_36]
MASPKYFVDVPDDKRTWKKAAEKASIDQKSLRWCQNLRSGSKITHEQFLLFRAICPDARHSNTFNEATHHLDMELLDARQYLAGSLAFQNFLIAIEQPATQTLEEFNRFDTTLLQLREVMASSDPDPNDHELAVTDETSVNSSLISFLQATAATIPGPEYQWRSARVRLTANFGTPTNSNQYIAFTDGQLQHIVNKNILAIAECKRYERSSHQPAVEMQEVGQVVAWLKSYPSSNDRYTLISQNGSEIYVTFPHFQRNWARYIDRGTGAPSELMVMIKYGPFKINSRRSMQQFAEIALAVILSAR